MFNLPGPGDIWANEYQRLQDPYEEPEPDYDDDERMEYYEWKEDRDGNPKD